MLRGFLTSVLAGGTGNLLYSLVNPNAYGTSASDNFGSSVDIDGNYAIVSAGGEYDNTGVVYVFNSNTRALLHTFTVNPLSDTGRLGLSIAVSGNYAIIGSPFWPDVATSEGRAYIFNVTTGELVHTLNNPIGGAGKQFGRSVAIDGNYAVVGAPYEDDAGGTSSGKAYIFNVTTGELVHTLNNPNPFSTSATDNFGYTVAIHGNYAIIGAPGEKNAAGTQNQFGIAYIYNVTTGTLVYTLNNPNAYNDVTNQDFFGLAVAIHGNYAIVGAQNEDDINGVNSGKAYIFNVTTGELVHTLNNPNAYGTSAYDYFGHTVAIHGNYAVVGAPYEDDAGGTSYGKAYIFNVTTGELVKTLDNPYAAGINNSTDSNFGNSIGMSSNKIIIGAEYQNVPGTPKLLGLNGVYSASALIAQQNVATTNESSFKVITTAVPSATIESIPYIAPNTTGLTMVVGLDANEDDNSWNVTPPWGTVTYLGTSYNSVFWGSNGYLTFGAGSSIYNNLGPAIPALPKIYIFGYDNFTDALWQGTEGTAPNRVHRVVINTQFDAYSATSIGNTTIVHEIRFYENELTRIDVHQQTIPFGGELYFESGAAHVYAL